MVAGTAPRRSARPRQEANYSEKSLAAAASSVYKVDEPASDASDANSQHSDSEEEQDEVAKEPPKKKAKGATKPAAAAKKPGSAGKKPRSRAKKDAGTAAGDAADADETEAPKPKKKAPAQPRKRAPKKKAAAAPEGVDAENCNSLFEAARSGSAALLEVASAWVRDFEMTDPEFALQEALNCILQTAVGGACRPDYKPELETEGDDAPSLRALSAAQWDDLVERFIEEVSGAAGGDGGEEGHKEGEQGAAAAAGDVVCPLMPQLPAAKAKAWRGHRPHYCVANTRCTCLVLNTIPSQSGGRVNTELLDQLVAMVITLCNTPLVGLRMAATVAGMALGEGLVGQCGDAAAKAERAERQLGGAQKGGAAQANRARALRDQLAQARAAEKQGAHYVGGCTAQANRARALRDWLAQARAAKKQASDAINALFHGVLAHRHLDVSAAVRAAAYGALARWSARLPAAFARDEQLRYLGWALDDATAPVRAAALRGLAPLYAHAAVADEDAAAEVWYSTQVRVEVPEDVGIALDVVIAAWCARPRCAGSRRCTHTPPSRTRTPPLKCAPLYAHAPVADEDAAAEGKPAVEANRLRTFTARFLPRMLRLTRDKSEDVCLAALELLREESVDDATLEEVYRCAFDLELPVQGRKEALAFYIDIAELIAVHVSALVPAAAGGDEEQADSAAINAAQAAADMLVEALWRLPQRGILFEWGAMLGLLSGGAQGDEGATLDEVTLLTFFVEVEV
ncbi:hypothetical protein JKP88DRAFT_331062 [Tribonema minus]|uniref:SCD domain-containing protein n=1 Tax=Tribonema minus TaxID=303371 RepID=A0A835YMF1_9STRA|nr:hypothetical protein JKP88DRAFT_331062 [Tribonema minus]